MDQAKRPKKNPNNGDTGDIIPSRAALALATRITPEIFADLYIHACVIDRAFAVALEETRTEERERIFKMGPLEILREYWRGRKLHASSPK